MVYAFMLIQIYSLGNVVRYGFLSKGNGIIDIYKAWCHDDDHCYFLVTFFSISSGNVIDILTQESTAGLYTNDFVKEISNRFCDEYTACCNNEDAHNLKLYAAFLNFFADLSSQFGTQLPFHISSDSVSDQVPYDACYPALIRF